MGLSSNTILIKTIKIVAAACLSIVMANVFRLDYAFTAGVVSILSIFDTRRSTLFIAVERIVSMVVALGIGAFVFYYAGSSVLSFGLFLTLYVAIAYHFNLQTGVAPCTVLVTHLFGARITWTLVINEVALMLIGTIIALLVNSFMVSHQNHIDEAKEEVDQLIQAVLLKFEQFLYIGDGSNEQMTVSELKLALKKIMPLVYQEQENQLFSQNVYDVQYFEMRRAQVRILEEMSIAINRWKATMEEAKLLASLMHLTAYQLHEFNPGVYLMQNVEEVLDLYRKRALPQTREEFENRAILYELLHDLSRFIKLKIDFYEEYGIDHTQKIQ